MRKLISFFSAIIAAAGLSVCTSAESGSPFTYEVKSDGTAIITGSEYTEGIRYGDVIIPSEIDGYTVTELGSECFSYALGIESVEIPPSVTLIGERAFADCYGISEVTFSEGLLTIGECAFVNCSYITEISIPDSVTAIKDDAFRGCSYLNRVTIGDGLTVINEEVFSDCYILSKVKLGENVKEIESYAFSNCCIKEIYIPAALEKVGYSAVGTDYECVVNYSGSKADWKTIDFKPGNSRLKESEIRFFTDANGRTNEKAEAATVAALFLYIAAALLVVILGIVFAVRGGDKSKCPYCRSDREDGAKFCGNCGSKF